MNTPQRLVDRFVVFSGAGKIQSDATTGILDAHLDTRDAVSITMEEVIQRRDIRDCKQRDLTDQKIQTRGRRFTFTYSEVTPQIMARWGAYFLGAVAAPTGTPADEVQTLTVSGAGTIAMTLEGRTVTTATISGTATAAEIQAALTAARMEFIQPGDVVVTGTGPFTLTFPSTGRLKRANLPTMVGTGGMSVAASANGAQKYHAITRATDDEKLRLSFALGWEGVTDRVEKYIGYAVESFTPTVSRRQPVGLTVTVIGPWEPEILTSFTIPECTSIDALMSDDVRVEIDSNWETADVNVETYTLNDNVPLDEETAYPFSGIDLTNLQRGDQPSYEITAGVFGSEVDDLYVTAANERTADPVDYKTHFGMPGNRFSLLTPNTKIKFQTNPLGTAGSLNESVIQIVGTPFKDGVTLPISAEAYVDQTAAFLVESV